MLLEGKVAIVSGIGPGMGRDIALALAREGADIVMGPRRKGPGPGVRGDRGPGSAGDWATCDIRHHDPCEELVATAVGRTTGSTSW